MNNYIPEFLIGLILIAVTTIIGFWKSKPRLGYSLELIPVLKNSEHLKGKVDIVVPEMMSNVLNVYLSFFRIKNLGMKAIEPAHFEKPLTLKFNKGSYIIEVVESYKNPKDLSLSISNTESSIEIKPLLMNRNDSFELKILIADIEGQPEIISRITGVSRLTIMNNYLLDISFGKILFAMIGIASLAFLILYLLFDVPTTLSFQVSTTTLSILMTMYVVYMIHKIKKARLR